MTESPIDFYNNDINGPDFNGPDFNEPDLPNYNDGAMSFNDSYHGAEYPIAPAAESATQVLNVDY